MADVLVVCEIKDGKLKKSSREALSIGRRLAAAGGGALHAFACDSAAASVAEEAGKHGAAKLHAGTDAQLASYQTEPHTAALAQVIGSIKPAVVLLPASSNGRDLAPRVAARLGVGVASDVTGLEWTGGKLRATRPVYSGKAIATVEVSGTPAIATLRANAFGVDESSGAAAEVATITYSSVDAKARLVETKAPETSELLLGEADIIVSGGRGLKESANYAMIKELATVLGAAYGASRAIVDDGWIDHQHQVGQTGRVVSPNLYVAVGISGAIQHLAGMTSSKHIVAINKDGDAPIFRVADLGVVGDLFQILPVLTEEIRKAKAH